jgi:hypothetical protein
LNLIYDIVCFCMLIVFLLHRDLLKLIHFCVLIVFSLHQESLKLILVDEPLNSKVILSHIIWIVAPSLSSTVSLSRVRSPPASLASARMHVDLVYSLARPWPRVTQPPAPSSSICTTHRILATRRMCINAKALPPYSLTLASRVGSPTQIRLPQPG